MVSFESFKKIFDRFITKYRRPTLEYWVKTLTSTLDHRVVFNFFVQARTSPMETKRSLKKPEMANMCLFFYINQRFSYETRGLNMEELIVWAPSPPYSPDLARMHFVLFSYLKSILREQRPKCSTISQYWHEIVFSKWVNWHEKCVELKEVYSEK